MGLTVDTSSATGTVMAASQSPPDGLAGTTMAFDFTEIADGMSDSGSDTAEEDATLANGSISASVRPTVEDSEPVPGEVPAALPPLEPADDAKSSSEDFQVVTSPSSRTNPIEVVLDGTKGIDRSAFVKIVCDDVDVVLKDLEAAEGETWYEILFEDGRVDQVPYDDLLHYPNGIQALHRFNTGYHETEDDMEAPLRKRRRTLNSDSDELSNQSELTSHRRQAKRGVALSVQDRRRRRLLAEIAEQGVSASSDQLLADAAGGRQLRQRPQRREEDVDELQQDLDPRDEDSDPTFGLVLSDLQPAKALKRRKRSSRLQAAAQLLKSGRHYRDSSIEFEDLRRSGRATRNQRNLREKLDDEEIYQQQDVAPAIPKVISIREIFQPVENAFREVHSQTCITCNGDANSAAKGPLIYCQGCSFTFHKVCLGYRSTRDHQVTKVGSEHFVLQCRSCIGISRRKDPLAPRHDTCQSCHEEGAACAAFSQKKTAKQEEKLRQQNDGEDPITSVAPDLINNPSKVFFRCASCRRAYHFEHLPDLISTTSPPDHEPSRSDLVLQYSKRWKCKDCVTRHSAKIQALVAWRPVHRDTFTPGATFLDVNEDGKEYLVKWEGKSYAHCTWVPGAWAWGTTAVAMRKSFEKKNDGPIFDTKEAIPEEYLMVDVILEVKYKTRSRHSSREAELEDIDNIDQVRAKFIGLGYDQVVWDAPPPRAATTLWAHFEAGFQEYLNGKYFKTEPPNVMKERIAAFRTLNFVDDIHLVVQPQSLRRGELMKYQLKGLNWLLLRFFEGRNAVLADEMGLGKTVQVIALIVSLVKDNPKVWPFLIVVPNSTCPNWRREIKFWAPELRVVTYHGGRVAQQMAYEHELFPNGSKSMKAHIVVMSYDSAQDDNTRLLFKSVSWAGLIVDEGQRLKNDQNLLYGALRAMRIPFRVLLTGTPLQNNKRELFNLLQFVDGSRDAAQLDEEFKELTAENLPQLHAMIRPFFLRRIKSVVLEFLPPMAHIIVPVTMTVLQEKLCKSIMAKNPDLIRAILSKGKLRVTERGSLNNILMQLRKCLCHPFIYSNAVEDRAVDPETMRRNLVEASAKLLLLEIMLPKLKEGGHRVLIFSQFLDQLDIIEDFLTGLGLTLERLDGTISSMEKQKRIDRFNDPNSPSPSFAFLLSTRAGGVGINLASADTVIILDPDFNPHQDLQAISRAHRIGQDNKVLCLQLMTKDSPEERMVQIGRSKMALDHALIESMDVGEDSPTDLESILKYGAEALFGDNEKDKIHYDSASVDKLLDRSGIVSSVKTGTGDGTSGTEAQFSLSLVRVWGNDVGDLSETIGDVTDLDETARASVWENILKQREQEAQIHAEQNKETVKYSDRSYFDDVVPVAGGGDANSDTDRTDEFVDAGEVEGQANDDSDDASKGELSDAPSAPRQAQPSTLTSGIANGIDASKPPRKGRPRRDRPVVTETSTKSAKPSKPSKPTAQVHPSNGSGAVTQVGSRQRDFSQHNGQISQLPQEWIQQVQQIQNQQFGAMLLQQQLAHQTMLQNMQRAAAGHATMTIPGPFAAQMLASAQMAQPFAMAPTAVFAGPPSRVSSTAVPQLAQYAAPAAARAANTAQVKKTTPTSTPMPMPVSLSGSGPGSGPVPTTVTAPTTSRGQPAPKPAMPKLAIPNSELPKSELEIRIALDAYRRAPQEGEQAAEKAALQERLRQLQAQKKEQN